MVLESGEDIVISGISGKFPESENIAEFQQKLYDGVDLVNDDYARWTKELYNIPTRSGKLKNLKQFDSNFFGIHMKQAKIMDPQGRILLELTYEAIIDAGINPNSLKGSKTGVFIGVNSNDHLHILLGNIETMSGYEVLGGAMSMLANRISYAFDFNGPSYSVDTACSSSLVALENAYDAIKTGKCDSAIVGGTNIILTPLVSIQFTKLGMLAPDGKSKAFDDSGDGFVRAEAISVIYLQKSKQAKRIYATILGAKINADGYKEQGITFPSGESQTKLLKEVYTEIGIDPSEVEYVEAHGTGTNIGDPQEVNSLTNVFCNNRKHPLLIGAVKSNMGHSEPASGLCCIAKVILSMETGIIPANLHYKIPNRETPALSDGRLKVVTENLPWNGGISAINSFGFGGANCHVVLKSNPKIKSIKSCADVLPYIVGVSGRSEEAVNYLLRQVQINKHDKEFIALVNDIHENNITNHNFRGFTILNDEFIQEISEVQNVGRPICFIYTGMGSQWPSMAKDLMKIKVFKESIARCSKVLKPFSIDLEELLTNSSESTFDNNINCFVCITSVQIALTNVLKSIGIQPDIIIGHSAGETGCGYADGGLTEEQAILVTYYRGRAIFEANLPPGAMAAVGLTWEEAQKRCPPGIYPACSNSRDSVTISGPPDAIKTFVAELIAENIFAKTVNSAGGAYHCKYIASAVPIFRKYIDKVIPEPKLRTSKWISSSIPESEWQSSSLAKKCSGAYQINNLTSPVLFYEALSHVPKNAIVIEIAPTGLLQSILKRTLEPNTTVVSLIKKDYPNNIEFLLSNIGKIYNAGAQPKVANLYPLVSYPVSKGTPMISPLVKWDHSTEMMVGEFEKISVTNKMAFHVDINKDEDMFLAGHSVDGRILYPATGYMVIAWKCLAKLRYKNYEQMPIVMQDVRFSRATILPKNGEIVFYVNIFDSGEFEITEGGSIVANGKIFEPEDIDKELLHLPKLQSEEEYLHLSENDIYKELRLRGYEYKDDFCGISQSDNKGINGKLKWNNNWITFIDTMLQFSIINVNTSDLLLPSTIGKFIINPKAHLEWVQNYVDNEDLPVCLYGDLHIVKSGAVEIREMTATKAPRRQLTHALPKLEVYEFIPNENNTPLTDHQALTVLSHIVYENVSDEQKLNIIEIQVDDTKETILISEIKNILELEPTVITDASIISPKPIDQTILEANEIKHIKTDIASINVNLKSHIIIFDSIARKESRILKFVSDSLIEGGFILLEESKTVDINNLHLDDFIIVSYQKTENKCYILLRKPIEIPSNAIIIKLTENDFKWVEPLKEAMKRSELNGNKTYLYSQGENINGIVGMVNCLKGEPGGNHLRAFFIQDKDAKEFSITAYASQIKKDLVHNVFKNTFWGSFRHLLMDQEKKKETRYAYMDETTRGDLSSLRWIEGNLSSLKEVNPAKAELCAVYYASLNFKDIMLASGKLVMKDLSVVQNTIGFEFSGVSRKGRRVMGIGFKSLATDVLSDLELTWDVPENWSLEEAATVPVAYTTAYYSLLVRGRIKRGESVLIHAGAGGVGIAAINIALSMGCTIFTTVGSQVKRDFIKKTFPQINDSNIGNSRDNTFEQMVLTQTKGRGVDVVLNCLAAEQLQASVRCLAQGGRFLEIGKVDLISNTGLGMSVFLKNSSFHGILVDSFIETDTDDKKETANLISEGILNGVIKPLPTTVFNDKNVEQAFRYLASAKHIGKVLVKIRDEETLKSIHQFSKVIESLPRTYMHPNKSYVIVGGLGGFGLELTKWLISRGATKIIVTSRAGVKTGYQSLWIRKWKELGVTVLVSTIDASTSIGAKELLKQAIELDPVGGIFNLAVILRDAFMENQTESSFEITCRPKVSITKELDAASREMAPYLDHFVTFSSVSCGRGNKGQANYGFANSVMERICEDRKSNGFPGLAIQWGAIGDVGVVIETIGGNDIEIGGTLPQRITSCLEVLDIFLQQKNVVVSSVVLADKHKTSSGSNQVNLVDTICSILGINDPSKVSRTATLVELGMDSLMVAEVKQYLQRNYDVQLSPKEIRTLTFDSLFKIGDVPLNTEGDSENTNTVILKKRLFEAVPTESVVRMTNKNSDNKTPVFLIHPVEGTVTTFKTLVEDFEFPVYGFQCAEEVAPLETISELANYYIKILKTIQPSGPYTIIGYSFGANVALEMALQIQKMKEKVKLLLIDGSPDFLLKNMSIMKEDADNYSLILAGFITQYANVDKHTILNELRHLPTQEQKILKCAEILSREISMPVEKLALATSMHFNKIKMCYLYKPISKLYGDITLIRAKSSMADKDYGIAQLCTGQEKIFTVDGNHHSILRKPFVNDVVKHINTFLTEQ